MFCSQAASVVSVFAENTGNNVYSCDFSNEGDIAAYTLYDSANTEGSVSYDEENQRLSASFGSSHSWADSNGIKTNITDRLKNCAAGSTVSASVKFTSTYWNDPIGKAKLFLEVTDASGSKQIMLCEGPESVSANDETVTLSGETAGYTYSSGDTVYLCVTQGSGLHYYDDISVSVEQGQTSGSIILNDDFANDDAAGYVVYDSANTGAAISAADGALGAKFGDAAPYDWNEKNGVKKDITSLVKSGMKYSVSADVYSSWWGGAQAKLFFEIDNGTSVSRVDIAADGLDAEGEGTVSLSGTAGLSFNDGDKVYLCITQNAGYHKYDNIVIKTDGTAEPVNTPPANTDEPGTVLNDKFDSGDAAGYVVYDSANTGAAIAAADGVLGANFGDPGSPYNWNEKNGVKKDITSLVKSGSKYSVSADVYSSWWGGAQAKLFFEIENGTSVSRVDIAADGLDAEGEGTVSLSGTAGLRFNEGDKVYICITQSASYQNYDNILIKEAGTAEPTAPANTDEPGTVLNDKFDSGDTAGYVVYDSTNTGAAISAADGVLGANYEDSWKETNGVKKDITSLVESGSKYSVSAYMTTSWWGGAPAKLFLEVAGSGGTKRIDIADDMSDGEQGGITLSGSADLWFSEGDSVYLCITQNAGYHTYDNIVMKYAGEADPEPVNTDTPSEAPTFEPVPEDGIIFSDDFSSEAQTGAYSIYDSGNTTAGAGISLDGGELVASMGTESWNASNGIRRDITEYAKQYISGLTFGVQLSLTAFWGDGNDASAAVFFETVSADGSSSVSEIGSFVPADGSETAVMRGSAQLSYKSGDKVYLCVTQMSGNHRYDNVVMWLENPNEEGVVPLTSGTRYTGKYFPEKADAVFSNTFSGNAAAEMEKYYPYNDVAYGTAEPRDGGAFFEFPEGGTAVRGVAVDITEAIENNIPNGGEVRISCKMLPWWWWGSASIKVRTGGTVSDVASYTASTGDPGGKWAVIGDTVELAHKPGEKVELIITMNSSSATGITIDDVCVELPYEDVTVRDIAVADASLLDGIDSVSIVYGGEYVTETSVSWGTPENGSNVVYGTAGIDGVRARAVITDSAEKVTVNANGVSAEKAELEYGKAVTAQGGDEMVFLLDSMENMNLISAVSGTGKYASPEEGTPEASVPMRVRDNGNGVTIEGAAAEAADNDKVIIIKDADGKPVGAAYARLGADGGYSAKAGVLPTGKYTAFMTDTGISAEFSYATADEFEELRNKINSGSAETLLSDETNRIILGASTYSQLDKLSSEDRSQVYSQFKSELGNKPRAEAAALFDALVTVKAAADEISEAEWTQMLDASASTLGLKGLSIYEQYKQLPEEQRESAKKKTDSAGADDIAGFVKAFSGAVLNTRLMNAGLYTNVQSILTQNAALFEGTGADVSSISTNAAKYIISNISDSDVTIEAIASLINEAKDNASSGTGNTGNTGGNGGSGGSGGGGGGGQTGPSNTISGTSIGLNANPSPTQSVSQTSAPAGFSDLSGYDWAETAVYYLANQGIINGYGDGTFRPGENVTREAFVKMIVSAFGIPVSGAAASFDDVAADRWSYSYIAAAAGAGIVTGVSDTEFAPETNITRQDAAVMLYRAMKYKGVSPETGELTFTDSASVADYAKEAVSALSGSGVINGMGDGSFAPGGITSRAQAAVMLYRVADTIM